MELLLRIKSLDVMAQPVNLNVQGRNGFKTIFGVLMTVGYFAGVVAIAVYIGSTYFDTTAPTVVTQTTEDSIFPKISLGENNILPALFMTSLFGEPQPASVFLKFVTPLFYRLTIKTSVDGSGKTATSYFTKQIPMLPCGDVLRNEISAKLYDPYIRGNSLFRMNASTSAFCANTTAEELYVEGGSNDLLQSYLILELYPCSLADPAKCATSLELMGIRIGNLGPSISMELSKFSDPVKRNVQIGPVYALSEQLLQKYSYKLARTMIKDISGPFGKPETRVNYSTALDPISNSGSRSSSQIACTVTQIVTKTCIPYLTFLYSSSGITTEIIRTYKTLLKTLSEIGGMNSVLFIICYYLGYAFAYFTKRENFVKMIFPFIYSKEFQDKVSEESKDDKGAFSAALFKENMHRIKDEAYNSIVRCLDVLNIVREMNNLKILTHIMMNKHHRNIASLVALNIPGDSFSPESGPSKLRTNLSPQAEVGTNLTPVGVRYNQVKGTGGAGIGTSISIGQSNEHPQLPLDSIKYLQNEVSRDNNLISTNEQGRQFLQQMSTDFCLKSLKAPGSMVTFVLEHSVQPQAPLSSASTEKIDNPKKLKSSSILHFNPGRDQEKEYFKKPVNSQISKPLLTQSNSSLGLLAHSSRALVGPSPAANNKSSKVDQKRSSGMPRKQSKLKVQIFTEAKSQTNLPIERLSPIEIG